PNSPSSLPRDGGFETRPLRGRSSATSARDTRRWLRSRAAASRSHRLDTYSNACSNVEVRWSGQELSVEADDALPGLARLGNLVRSVQTPEFAGLTFHEVLAKSALNHVP